MKRPIPVTSCTECGNAGYNPTSSTFVVEKRSRANGVRAQIQAQSTILIGNNVPPATALEPNVMRLAFDAEERDGF